MLLFELHISNNITKNTDPKNSLFWTKKCSFWTVFIFTIPNPHHHPKISISPISLVLHYHCGASSFHSTHAHCCLSTSRTPGFCPYLQRKRSTLEKSEESGVDPPPSPSNTLPKKFIISIPRRVFYPCGGCRRILS